MKAPAIPARDATPVRVRVAGMTVSEAKNEFSRLEALGYGNAPTDLFAPVVVELDGEPARVTVAPTPAVA